MNIKYIAKLANVSKTTVSRVLNNSPLVKKETRDKVITVIEKEAFLPNYIAKSLKTKRTKVIGVVFPDIGNPFYYEILKGIETLLDKNDYNMMFCDTRYNDQKELKSLLLLLSRKVDGVIIAPSSPYSKGVELLYEKNIPFVVLDILPKNIKTNNFLVDHYNVSYVATNYLIENGHKKIFIIDNIDKYESKNKFTNFQKGYIKAMKKNSIPIRDYYINRVYPDISGGYKIFKEIIFNTDFHSRLTAIS